METETKIVYKVVHQVEGQLESVFAPSFAKQSYDIGHTTYPLQGTKLFAFAELKDAQAYAQEWEWGSRLCDYFVYEAEATNVVHNGFFHWKIPNIDILLKLFRHESVEDYAMAKPEAYLSCVVCDSIKLIRRVK